MKFKCLSSGSSGNCYILDNGEETLILDCGVSMRDIKVGLNFRIDNVACCLVTHKHSDHTKSLKKIKQIGFDVYAPYEQEGKSKEEIIKKTFGTYIVYAFQVPHNDCTNYGFLIESKGEKLLYLTDFEYCPFNFDKQEIEHLLVECNYQDEFVDEDKPNFVHKVLGHCNLETAKNFIDINKSKNLKSVILIHLGEYTTDKAVITSEIKNVVGEDVFVDCAYKGMELELS